MDFRSRFPCFGLIALLTVPVFGAGLAGCGKGCTDSAMPDPADRCLPSSATSDRMAGSGGVYSSAGGTSAAVWIEDAAITTNLNAALLADAMLKGTSISVASPNGEVVLTGTANSQTQREHAAQSARVLHGVQNVNNKPAINQ